MICFDPNANVTREQYYGIPGHYMYLFLNNNNHLQQLIKTEKLGRLLLQHNWPRNFYRKTQ